jgi:polysaccharide export outer membrane protein
MKLFNTTILFFFVLLLGACSSTSKLPPQPEAGGVISSVLIKAYKMSVGDQLEVTVWKNPELSFSAPIRPDGKIAVPLIGDVMAAGQEPEQLAETIKGQLTHYIKSPNVTVMLMSLQGQSFLSRIRVTGAVANNISIGYTQGMTVLDAILEAGSVSQYADSNRTKLHRRTEGGTETYLIRLKNILEDGDMKSNIMLLPGDVLTVPERLF